jgi:hypothetical protein
LGHGEKKLGTRLPKKALPMVLAWAVGMRECASIRQLSLLHGCGGGRWRGGPRLQAAQCVVAHAGRIALNAPAF